VNRTPAIVKFDQSSSKETSTEKIEVSKLSKQETAVKFQIVSMANLVVRRQKEIEEQLELLKTKQKQ
jgi:hypothetical protein